MAWDPLDGDLHTGDRPMDAFGIALTEASLAWERAHGRLPTFTELSRCFLEAAEIAQLKIEDPDQIAPLLARWLAGPSGDRPAERRVAVRRGDVFRIPYTHTKAVYGIVLFVESPREPRPGPGIGTLISIRDRDVELGEDPAVALAAPVMFMPVHTYEALRDGRWPVLGRVTVEDDLLPRMRRDVPGPDGTSIIETRSYFGDLVEPMVGEHTAEHDGVSPVAIVREIRAERGLGRSLPTRGLHVPPDRLRRRARP